MLATITASVQNSEFAWATAIAFFLGWSFSQVRHAFGLGLAKTSLKVLILAVTGATGAKAQGVLHQLWEGANIGDIGLGKAGLGSLGAIFGVLIAANWMVRRRLPNHSEFFDNMVAGVLLTAFIARFGCLLGGCCQGTLPGAVHRVLPVAMYTYWPCLDQCALAGSASVGIGYFTTNAPRSARHKLFAVLGAYLAIRFAIEALRPVPLRILNFEQVLVVLMLAYFWIVSRNEMRIRHYPREHI
ncbi:MAG TPA: prolipoprotein diacylglyceryl transferase [Candidatus Hydrogenedentes bacterium]|nr:prolipoprotein diacylglyceryl transferase [Candidatus Hydrogenedentota bacterium]